MKKDLQIVTSESSVGEGMYVTMMAVVCSALHTRTDQPGSVTVLNKHAKAGYVYESPDKCERVVEAPADKLRIVVLADTHLF